MALSLRHGSQGGGRAYALATMDARGIVTIQHNAPEIGQGTHNLFSVVAAQTLGIPQSQIQRAHAGHGSEFAVCRRQRPAHNHADGQRRAERLRQAQGGAFFTGGTSRKAASRKSGN